MEEKHQLTIWQVVQHLTWLERLQLLGTLAITLVKGVPASPQRQVSELKGLGKTIWESVDASDYVQQQRATWDG